MKLVISPYVSALPKDKEEAKKKLQALSRNLVLVLPDENTLFQFTELNGKQEKMDAVERFAYILCREPQNISGNAYWTEVMQESARAFRSSAWRPIGQPEGLAIILLFQDLEIEPETLEALADKIRKYWNDPF